MKIPTSDAAPPAYHAPPTVEPTAKATPSEGPSRFAQVLARLGGRIDHGEKVVDSAANGGENVHDPAALLHLQANIYRYVEAIDLASKLIDRATTAVKTVLQNQ